LPRNKVIPTCPACGSNATMPFENEENARTEQTFAEIILTIFLLFLVLFIAVLLFLLSHASLPIGTLIILVIFLFWRQKRDSRRAGVRPRKFVCLDCSRNFKA
jgi:ABC-type phosphate transport system permease subunit